MLVETRNAFKMRGRYGYVLLVYDSEEVRGTRPLDIHSTDTRRHPLDDLDDVHSTRVRSTTCTRRLDLDVDNSPRLCPNERPRGRSLGQLGPTPALRPLNLVENNFFRHFLKIKQMIEICKYLLLLLRRVLSYKSLWNTFRNSGFLEGAGGGSFSTVVVSRRWLPYPPWCHGVLSGRN